MYYRAKLLAGRVESAADGDTEQQAIDRALADSVSVRTASEQDAHGVALVMFHVYPGQTEPQYVSYATTLGKYRIDTN